MLSATPRWTLLSAGALTAVLSLSACSGNDTVEAGPAPATSPTVSPSPSPSLGTTASPTPSKLPKGDKGNAPKPASTLPSPVQSLVVNTDVGEYLVKPTSETTPKQIADTIAKLKTMKGVQSAELRADGYVDLVFRADPAAKVREAAVRQLAVLGEVEEGV